ncbi:hypothetical protein FRB94_011366 [Tulasnella sp. JGI-2019a]|nr:hypothetical protein FRB94_011366 [Tulasnella sp. JGI-2019a]KAG9038531.1 hypothetical protein FRB95_000752 [Tulasnella sp. JGI-2019a]
MPATGKKKRNMTSSTSKFTKKSSAKSSVATSSVSQIEVKIGALSVSQDDPVPAQQEELEDPRAVRALKRAKQKAQNMARAEAAKEQGNKLFKAGRFEDAIQCYEGALMICPNNPAYHSNVALAYLKVGALREAEASAEFALDKEPKNLKARYRRGLARQRLGRLKSAKADFLFMLRLDPECKEAKEHLAEVTTALREMDSAGPRPTKNREMKVNDHGYDDDKEDLDEDFDEDHTDSLGASDDFFPDGEDGLGGFTDTTGSHTSDYDHGGNKIPCYAYNHGGCPLKTKCPFSHGPGDEETIRDNLGKNVCLRFLADECPFGDQCLYSHSKSYLPTRGGPWNDSKHAKRRFENIKNEIDAAVYDNFRDKIAHWRIGLGPKPEPSTRKVQEFLTRPRG